MNANFGRQQLACSQLQQQQQHHQSFQALHPQLHLQQQHIVRAIQCRSQQQQHQHQQQHSHPLQLVQQQRRLQSHATAALAAAAAAAAAAPSCQLQKQQHRHIRHSVHSSVNPCHQRHCHHHHHHEQQRTCSRTSPAVAAAADAFNGSSSSSSSSSSGKAIPPRIEAAADEETYSLKDTQILVETAMLSAVSGLAFLLSTLLKLDNSLGYFLPLPITIAACRSGVAAGWHTMMATAFLLLVLLGPLRAITYVLMHGVLAASLGSMWVWKWPWAISIPAGAVLRMAGQLGYLVLSSVTMNENLFQVMLANVHNLLDQLSAALGSSGSPSTLAITSMIFALLLVNGICYVFLLHVVYHVILGAMGFKLGALPGFVKKYLYAGVPQQQQQQQPGQ